MHRICTLKSAYAPTAYAPKILLKPHMHHPGAYAHMHMYLHTDLGLRQSLQIYTVAEEFLDLEWISEGFAAFWC